MSSKINPYICIKGLIICSRFKLDLIWTNSSASLCLPTYLTTHRLTYLLYITAHLHLQGVLKCTEQPMLQKIFGNLYYRIHLLCIYKLSFARLEIENSVKYFEINCNEKIFSQRQTFQRRFGQTTRRCAYVIGFTFTVDNIDTVCYQVKQVTSLEWTITGRHITRVSSTLHHIRTQANLLNV